MSLPKLKLKYKLLSLFVLTAVVSLLIVNILWFNSSKNQVISITSSEVDTVARRAETLVESFLSIKELSLIIHSQTDAIIKQDNLSMTKELKNFLLQDEDITELTVLNKNGLEVVKLNRDQVFSSDQLKDQSTSLPFKITTFVGGERYISPIYYNSKNEALIDIAIPIVIPKDTQDLRRLSTSAQGSLRSTGEILGIIKQTVHLKKLLDTLNTIKVGKSGYVILVDDKGNVLSDPTVNLLVRARNLKGVAEVDNYLKALTHNNIEGKVNQTKDSRGETVLSKYLIVSPVSWGVIAQVPLFDTLDATNSIAGFAFILFLIILSWVILAGFWISDQISKPIESLRSGAEFIGEGNLGYRLNIKSQDEIEDLGDSFNLMTANLQTAFKKQEVDKNTIVAEKNKLDFTISNIADGVIAVDLNYRIIIFNKIAEHMTGTHAEQAIGKRIDQLIKFFDKEREVGLEEYCHIYKLDGNRTIYYKEGLNVVSGKDKKVSANLTTVQIEDGAHVNLGAILTLHDVSQEKALEEMKLDFVSMAAHELRTPLTSIKGYLDVFIKENSLKLSDEQNMFVKSIQTATKQLEALVENLLNVSRIERGVTTVSLAPVEWLPIVEQTLKDLEIRIKEKGLVLNFQKPTNPLPQVLADKVRIVEVLSNLITNALNYTEKGGQISVSITTDSSSVTTHVSDTGIGIPKEAIPNLFRKFYRVDGSYSRKTKGTGLGLYITKSIMDMHHGKVWVNSEVGKGSTFSFSLPIQSKSDPLK